MFNFLKLSDWGNLLGIISIFLGMISIWLTVRTLQKTKDIEKRIDQERISAIEKTAFNAQLQELKKEIASLESRLIETDVLDYKLAKQLFNEICKVASHKGIFSVEDQERLEKLRLDLMNICESIRNHGNINYQMQCLDALGTLNQIVQKGSYRI